MLKILNSFLNNKRYLPLRLALLVWLVTFMAVFLVFDQRQYLEIGFLPETGIIDVCRQVDQKSESNQLQEIEQGYVEFCNENVNTSSTAINYPAPKLIVIIMGVMLISLILYFLIKYEFAKSALSVFDKAFIGGEGYKANTGFASWMLLLFFVVIGVLFIADNYI